MLVDENSGSVSRGTRRLAEYDVLAAWEILHAAPEAADWSEAAIRNSLLAKESIALVSEMQGGEILGCVFGVHISGEAEIQNLAVRPAYRRRGIAKELVRELLVEWVTQGVFKVFLEVRQSNSAAIKLYEGLGFRQIGRRKAYYSAPGEDALVLGWAGN